MSNAQEHKQRFQLKAIQLICTEINGEETEFEVSVVSLSGLYIFLLHTFFFYFT